MMGGDAAYGFIFELYDKRHEQTRNDTIFWLTVSFLAREALSEENIKERLLDIRRMDGLL